MKEFVSYDSFLNMMKKPAQMEGVKGFMESALSEGQEMSIEEANELLNSLEVPEEIREWIEFESRGDYSYNHAVKEGAARLVDFLPEMDQSLNEDAEWLGLNEEEVNQFESVLWESIYEYIAAESISEGFWSSMVSKVKAGSKKAIEVGKMLVTGVGKFIKGIIQATAKGLKAVGKMAIGLGKGLMDKIKGRAEKRMERMNKHSEEQVDQDTGDLGSTVSWFTGKGVDQGVEDGVKNAAKVGGAAMQADEEGKKEAAEKIKKAEMAGKQSAPPAKPQPKKNENEKAAYRAATTINALSKDDLYELASACFMLELKEAGQLNESTIKSGVEGMNISEGLWSKIKSAFGFGKDEKDKEAEAAQKELPGVKDEEEKLKKKDEEKIKNTKAPSIDAPSPENKMEDKAKDAEASVEKGGSGLGKVLAKIARLVIQGPILIVEWVVEYGLKRALKFFSACVKKLGGPGIFLLITIAAAGAILIGLAIEAAVVGDHKSMAAKVFHFGALGSAVAWLEHALEHAASAAANAVAPWMKWIPVALSTYFAIMHLKHIFHDRKMGKNVNHSKAIELEEKALKDDDVEAKSTDNDEIKKLLEEKSNLHQQVIKFHKEMRDEKIKLTKKEKDIKDEKDLMKDHAKKGGVKSELADITEAKENISAAKEQIKARKESLESDEKKDNPDNKKRIESSIKSLEEELSKSEKKLEDMKKKIKEMDDPNGDAKEALKRMEKMKHLEHELHHDEHELQHEFKSFFSDEKGPHKRIKEITKKIKELKGAAKESLGLHDYAGFLNESKKDFGSYLEDLEESYYREHSSLRTARTNKQIDEWITQELGVEVDEEFHEYSRIGAKGKSLEMFEDDEEELKEGAYSLLPKTEALFNEIGKKYSGFRVGTLSKWEEWNYRQTLPIEVETAAKELGAPFDKIQVFKDEDNPDAYDMFVSELPSLRTLSKEGEYTDRRGNKVRFAVTVNC